MPGYQFPPLYLAEMGAPTVNAVVREAMNREYEYDDEMNNDYNYNYNYNDNDKMIMIDPGSCGLSDPFVGKAQIKVVLFLLQK